MRIKAKPKDKKNNGLEFVREGQTTRKKSEPKSKEHSIGLLNRVRDWELRVDLDKRLVFPFKIDTRLRPDMILYSTANKLLIIIEPTVPWESMIDKAYERKYSDLCDDCREKGWYVWCYPVEVGCLGFVGTSHIRALRRIRLTGKERNKAVNEISDVGGKASSW